MPRPTVPSPTVTALDPDQLDALLLITFGATVRATDYTALTGGGFASVWRADLDDGRSVVIKVSPPAGTRLLRYEHDLLAAEASYFQLVRARAPHVPVPKVLYYGQDPSVFDGQWLVTSHLPGTPLPRLRELGCDDTAVRAELGTAIAHLHTVSGPRYGYTGTRPHGGTWREAFTAMIEALLADADDWAIELPASADRLRQLLGRDPGALDLVRRPALVHFDLWDGNVLTLPGHNGTAHLAGLVDGERYLYGDPLIDFVSTAMYRHIEDEPGHPFLSGYVSALHAPFVLDEPARRRLTLYRTHLYLLMTVEMPSRGMTAQSRPARHRQLADLLDAELTELGRW